MFDHSIKVPRLYKTAAKIYQQVKTGNGSVKQLVYEKKHPNIKALYALVVETIRREDELNKLIKKSEILDKESRFDPWLARILITELLFGKKRLPGESKPIKTVLAYEQIFKAHLSDNYIPKASEINQVEKPRYVRVNTLTCTLQEAIDAFRDEGWALNKYLDKINYDGFIEKVSTLNEDEFLPDIHISDLLVFPPKTQFYRHPAYKKGYIILQDKASCLPVHILAPPPGSTVLDMCAAPGMKTTQLAAAIKDQGTIYACEQDLKRFNTLETIVAGSGATCIKCFNKDIITCDAETFPNVEYILVDPSCTGSGITDRLDKDKESHQNQERLTRLAGFQIKILRCALTKYPAAKRVVYSTCSIYPEENEDVVRQVLETNSNFKLVSAKEILNNVWKNVGSEDYGDIGRYCIYAKPEDDLTNGFFVAVFERLEEGEKNQFFNTKIYNYKKFEQGRKRNETNYYKDEIHDNFSKNKRPRNLNNEEDYEENYEEQETAKEFDVTETSPKEKKKKIVLENSVDNEEDGSSKKKKRKEYVDLHEDINSNHEEFEKPEKKKKKRKECVDLHEDINSNHEEFEKPEKKKKKRKDKNTEETDFKLPTEECEPMIQKKKKKKTNEYEIEVTEELPNKKKKKKKSKDSLEENLENAELEQPVSKKKKLKSKEEVEGTFEEVIHKKKKKHMQREIDS